MNLDYLIIERLCHVSIFEGFFFFFFFFNVCDNFFPLILRELSSQNRKNIQLYIFHY